MIRLTLLGAAAVAAPLAAFAQPAPPTGPVLPQEYAVKFVCGRSDGEGSFAAGTYFTAINVHNPTRAARIAEKVALADLGRPGPMTDLRPGLSLRYDQAIEFDCRWIARRLRAAGITPPDLFTGFLVLQSGSLLDVVAVYTASGRDNGVSTMHTERVPVRRVM
jgi:hypothetical protein